MASKASIQTICTYMHIRQYIIKPYIYVHTSPHANSTEVYKLVVEQFGL